MEKTDQYTKKRLSESKLQDQDNLSDLVLLLETGLTPREITKYGERRVQKFLDKINSGSLSPFVDDTTGGKVILPQSKNTELIGWLESCLRAVREGSPLPKIPQGLKAVLDDGTRLALGKIKKTEEFGGKPETVAGSTEEVESLVAIFLAAGLQGRSGKVPTILDLPHDDQYYRTLNLDMPVSQVLQHFDSLSGDLEKADKVERWIEGSRVTAQKIIEYLGEKRNYIVYRNPPQIYEIFKELNKRYGNRNKWTPADIWVIDSQQFQVTVDKHKSEEEQWKEFNCILRKAFNDKVAVGISLKSIYNLDSPKLEEFNNHEEGQWKSTAEGLIRVEDCIEPNFEFQITGLGSCKFLWERKQGKRDSLSFRLANMEGFSSFNVEYQPSDSKGRGGKAGIPAINYEFRRLGYSTLPEEALGRKSTIAQQFIRKQGEDYTRYVDLLKKYRGGLSGGTVESYLSQSPSRMLSKYLSLICYDNFMKMEKESRYQFLTGVLEYAISTTEDSAPFIKVY